MDQNLIRTVPEQAWRRVWHMRFRVLDPPSHLPRPFKLQRHIIAEPMPLFYNRQRQRPERRETTSLRLALAGTGAFDHARQLHTVLPGQAFFTVEGDDGWGIHPTAQEPWEWFAFEFLGAQELVRELVQRLGVVFQLAIEDELLRPLLRFRRHRGRSLAVGHVAGARLVTDLLAGLLEREQHSDAAADRRIVQTGWDLIDGYAAKGLSVQDLAARIGIGPEHLARVFRRYEGCTPQAAIASVRMQHAAGLLVRERLPVKAVANRVGYATASHFSRAFKRVFGVTPAQFQRSGREAWLP